ncbi:MAG: hypothetical protein HQM13_01000 [SAR324 cluster bacterium]|nr:hypothetical protein [SAR324 cluster bacterium]
MQPELPLTPKLEKAIEERFESSWNRGEEHLDFYLTYLSVEVEVFEHEESYFGNLLNEGEIADRIEKIAGSNSKQIQNVLRMSAYFWAEMNIQPRLLNAREISSVNLIFGDLIFVHLKLPETVASSQRYKAVRSLCGILRNYRKNNPDAIIVSVSDQSGFVLAKDDLSLRWPYNLKKLPPGSFAELVRKQLESPKVFENYFFNRHTGDKLDRLVYVQDMQDRANRLQSLQTDIKLLILIHPELYDEYAEKIRYQLMRYHFKTVLVKRTNEFSRFMLKKFDYFILFQCDFPLEVTDEEFEAVSGKIFKLESDLNSLEIEPTDRSYHIKNKLEERFLKLQENIAITNEDSQLIFLQNKYQEYFRLIQARKEAEDQIKRLNQKLISFEKGYFALIEALLMDVTKQTAGVKNFEQIMKNFMYYLIVDDFSPSVIDYLVSQKFPRYRLNYLNNFELFDLFQSFRQGIPETGASAYRRFFLEYEGFTRFDVILINSWNLDREGNLLIKFRLRMPRKNDIKAISKFRDRLLYSNQSKGSDSGRSITISAKNINEFLDMGNSDLISAQVLEMAGQGAKMKREVEENLRLKDLYRVMISSEDLRAISKIVGLKKRRLSHAKQLELQIETIRAEIKEQAPLMRGEEYHESDKSGKATEKDLFAPLEAYNLKKLELLALGCGITQLKSMEHLQSGNFIVEEAKRSGQSALQILNKIKVRIATKNKELPETGIRNAFPQANIERLHYREPLPEKEEFESGEFLILLIDYEIYGFDAVVRCLQQRVSSSMGHIPVILLISPSVKLDRYQESIIETLIGFNVEESGTVDIFPMPYRLESLENPQKVKYFIHEVLGVNQLLKEKKPEDGDNEGGEHD